MADEQCEWYGLMCKNRHQLHAFADKHMSCWLNSSRVVATFFNFLGDVGTRTSGQRAGYYWHEGLSASRMVKNYERSPERCG